MIKYTLSLHFFRIPFDHEFEAPDDDRATWYARGYIDHRMGHDPDRHVGSKWRLDRTPDGGPFTDDSLVGTCEIEKRGDDVGQQWMTVHRRRPHVGPDMNVGDPHDEPSGGSGSSSPGQVLKRASGAKRK